MMQSLIQNQQIQGEAQILETINAEQNSFDIDPSTDITPVRPLPFLWFDDNTEEALHFFISELQSKKNCVFAL
jgi:hypothetical protein